MFLAQPTSQKLDACIVGRGPDSRTARSQPMLRCLLQILNGGLLAHQAVCRSRLGYRRWPRLPAIKSRGWRALTETLETPHRLKELGLTYILIGAQTISLSR